ncbi:putative cytochrome p450 protein [Neofusicoccum parvum UCRNP2]|uniref:Putative cytochrome p450 protein n=1 Tax=Botryosphaeria parva (strain UCR-NP2) TaxID=1287680 RepID=R1E9A6_BOTPV|nr:putative cytochrome p450 protein [Neofusicoccum parvum UCRNP2]
MREFSASVQNIARGYNKYGKFGKPFLTSQLTWKPEVVLPPQHIKWLIDQPDSVLSIHKVLIEDVAFNYTSPRAWDFHRPFHVEALNKINLSLITPSMVSEISLRTASAFGDTPGEWITAPLQQSVLSILLGVTNRAFVGPDLAHNPAYAAATHTFITTLLVHASRINFATPALLKPLLGPLLALPCRRADARCRSFLEPRVRAHLAAAATGAADERDGQEDVLQLLARCAVRSGSARDRDASALASRLLALSFVGVHTSAAAAVNALVDLLSAGPGVWAALRGEAAAALGHAEWSRAAVGRLVLLDSALRESLRFSAFKARGVEREVVARAGVVLPGGTWLPPGRFFSAHELKLLFAHLLLNYDFEFLDERPESTWITDFFTYTEEIQLRVRRREKSAHLD